MSLNTVSKSQNSKAQNNKTIGQVAAELKMSTHTLRYYEKIGLLSGVSKDGGGRRQYDQSNIAQIQFIRRAQRMQFSLEEIRQLLHLDSATILPKSEVQSLVKVKLQKIDDNLNELMILKNDLTTLLNRCISSQTHEKCPILEGMKPEDDS